MLRKLVLAVVSAVLVLGVLAVPASASPPPGALEINAIPGTRIDICSGGKEVLSNLKYGRASRWDSIEPATQTWSVRKAALGKCKGKRLARFTYTFEWGSTYTIIYWRPKGVVKVKIYKNDDVPKLPGESSLRMHHAAKAGSIDMWAWQKVPAVAAANPGPTIDGLKKGTSSPGFAVPERDSLVIVVPERRTSRWSAASGGKLLNAGIDYQVVFMGSTQKNMRVRIYASFAY